MNNYLFWDGRFKYDPICKRTQNEWLRYENKVLSYSCDGGATWEVLSSKLGIFSRFLIAFKGVSWTPFIDCFGWRGGKIAIAWHDLEDEDEVNIGKFIALYDHEKECWSIKFMGVFALSDGVQFNWFESVGFEIFNRIRQKDPVFSP